MEERAFTAIRLLSREELESFALRAAFHVGESRKELESRHFFFALLVGFVLGASVAAAGFLMGASLS
jgi:pilus assembly protein TadC